MIFFMILYFIPDKSVIYFCMKLCRVTPSHDIIAVSLQKRLVIVKIVSESSSDPSVEDGEAPGPAGGCQRGPRAV